MQSARTSQTIDGDAGRASPKLKKTTET
jgi:hypothetical protein